MKIIYAKEDLPLECSASIFLAGPTPRKSEVLSWRSEALGLLERAKFPGIVFVPEPRSGEWGSGPDAYLAQVEWEKRAMDMADILLFWVPRNMKDMPALTTNVEFGRYLDSGKIVFGAPQEAESVRYLEWLFSSSQGGVRHLTLWETVQASLLRILDLLKSCKETTSLRKGGEVGIPLHIWATPSLQAWRESQEKAGNEIRSCRLLWKFQVPGAPSPFCWILQTSVWVAKENRLKDNEFVFARTDISAAVLYYRREGHADPVEVILVREFRSPARTEDGFIRELPGGSSTSEKDPKEVVSSEVKEETGLIIEGSRFSYLGSAQVAGTLSSHHCHLFSAELTSVEMARARKMASSQETFGVASDTEKTYLEVHNLSDLLSGSVAVDWATLGMISRATSGF